MRQRNKKAASYFSVAIDRYRQVGRSQSTRYHRVSERRKRIRDFNFNNIIDYLQD
jgi:hypothetical protein